MLFKNVATLPYGALHEVLIARCLSCTLSQYSLLYLHCEPDSFYHMHLVAYPDAPFLQVDVVNACWKYKITLLGM